jgi:glutamyl-Q tRNA(Asp) synthetase
MSDPDATVYLETSTYRGRFAPSPTGPLHLGSLVTAIASYLEARRHGGQWLVRIEDLDPPREVAGAADDMLRTLEAFGLHWDGAVEYQSRRHDHYDHALERLQREGHLYACGCSRREIAAAARRGPAGPIYPGTCRKGVRLGRGLHALRVRTDETALTFHDRLQGPMRHNLEQEVGDFVLRRADGLYAYHLAVVVDDAAQGITDIVRGSDLLDSTPCHLHLQVLLQLATPSYLHLPAIVDARGVKLSKQTGAPAVCGGDPVPDLHRALALLGQAPPPDLARARLSELWAWALASWRPTAIPRRRALPAYPPDAAAR